MFKDTDDFKKYISGKKAAVIGVGISNRPLIRFLHKLGAKITAFDISKKEDEYIQDTIRDFENEGICIEWSLGKDYLSALKGFDIVFKTPRLRPDDPALLSVKEEGSVVTSEMELFMECCPCKTIGITGSDGKTTTTTIISKILERSGYNVHLGGNIGNPLIDILENISPDDIAVIELSSFQLQSMSVSPDIAVVTNIKPNHLDFHKNYDEYIAAKMNIFLYQNREDLLILNYSDPNSERAKEKAKARIEYFPGRKYPGDEKRFYAWYDEDNFYFGGYSLPIKEISLPGIHNLNNYCAAICSVKDIADKDAILSVMHTFKGVEHRREFIREIDGVEYYNSSIDSSPDRTIVTLNSFADAGKRVVLITGGKDKNCDYYELGSAVLRVSSKVIFCGENAPKIKDSILSAVEKHEKKDIIFCDAKDYWQALKMAKSIAEPGEAVVLSPSGTSFDRFKNFEKRGVAFKKAVMDLTGEIS